MTDDSPVVHARRSACSPPALLRRHRLVCVAVLGMVLGAGTVCSSEPAAAQEPPSPIARLQALGLPFKCRQLTDSGGIDAGDVTDPTAVEHIQLGTTRGVQGELPRLPDSVFDIFPLFPRLQSIRLEYFLLDPETLRRLKDIPHLKMFSVHISAGERNKSFQVPEDLDFLAELPDLEYLSLTSCDLNDEMIVKLLPLQSLKTLRLDWNYKLTQALVPTLEKLPALESLGLYNTSFAPPPIEARRLASKLKSFTYSAPTLTHNQTFSWEDFREIVTFPRHTWRYAHRTQVPLADIASLLPGPVHSFEANLNNWSITLAGVDPKGEEFEFGIKRPLSDADLRTVGQMAELRRLSIVSRNATRSDFTDDGLRGLTGLRKLESLQLESVERLTQDSLGGLSAMPSLRNVELRGIDLDAGGLAWVRAAPLLEELQMFNGTVHGDALSDLAHAPKLQTLVLGDFDRHGPDDSISITRPAQMFAMHNIKHLTLVSSTLTAEECEIATRFRSLETLTLSGPVTDDHLRRLPTLERLSMLTVRPTTKDVDRPAEPAGQITPIGLQRLRHMKTPIYLCLPSLGIPTEQAMADQFGWRFYGCSSGCCDTVPIGGEEWTIEGGRVKRKPPESINYSDDKRTRAIRFRRLGRLNRLVLDKQDFPPTADTLCLTDCHVDELHFRGWLPESIRIWGDSHVARIVVSNVAHDAHTSLRYHYLEGVTAVIVPVSDRLRHVGVADCPALNSLRLEGFYPQLEQLELRGVEQLRYLSAPHRGDAPRLEFPADSHWGTNLPSLRLLKLPGTAIGSQPVTTRPDPISNKPIEVPRFPAGVIEVDLRDTPIGDEWLRHLAGLRSLKMVRIGECQNLTEEARAAFREKRPDVTLDEWTVHRPGL